MIERWLNSLLVSIVGGIVDLDSTAAFQIMLSQPIVAAPLAGLTLGLCDGMPEQGLQIGLMVGSLLQLVWIEQLPLGMNVPPDAALASVLAVSLGYLAGIGCDSYVIREVGNTVALLLGVPLGLAGRSLDMYIRKLNTHLDRWVSAAVEQGRIHTLTLGHFLGGALTFAKAALVCFAVTMLGVEPLKFFVNSLNINQLSGMIVMQGLLPAVGFAVLASRTVHSNRELIVLLLAIATFALVLESAWWLVPILIVYLARTWEPLTPGLAGRTPAAARTPRPIHGTAEGKQAAQRAAQAPRGLWVNEPDAPVQTWHEPDPRAGLRELGPLPRIARTLIPPEPLGKPVGTDHPGSPPGPTPDDQRPQAGNNAPDQTRPKPDHGGTPDAH